MKLKHIAIIGSLFPILFSLVGNNQMYHAGDPIGYADLNSSYWQQHLIGAGRVKQ